MSERWIFAAYAYSALHILGWRILLEGNGSGAWEQPYSVFFVLFFLPLNLLGGGLCRLAWGKFDILTGCCVVGLIADWAIASLVSTTSVVAVISFLMRRRRRGLSSG